MKRSILLKSVVVALAMILGTSTVSAQKFLNKVKKAAEVVTGTEQTTSDDQQSEEELKKEVEKAIKPVNFEVMKVNIVDENGNQVKNEDGTDKYVYKLKGNDGKLYDLTVAKKYVTDSWKAVGSILAKVGINAAKGAIAGGVLSGGKGAAVGAGTNAAASLLETLLTGDEIKQIKANRETLKNVRKLLAEYEQTFTEEGLPREASVDMSKWDDCEAISMTGAKMKEELEERAAKAPAISEEEMVDFFSEI